MWQRQDGVERQMDDVRRRVSARLHSSITQSLAALTANLDLIAGSAQQLTPARRRLLGESRAIARDCFQQVRALADELHPPLIAEVGLSRALAALVAGYVERTHVPVVCEPRECPRLPEDVETAMYRLVEECLNDLRPPVASGAASVVLRPTRRFVELTIVPVTLDAGIRWRRHLGGRFAGRIEARVAKRSSSDLAFVVTISVANRPA
jgi:signal transduction histidine kinase